MRTKELADWLGLSPATIRLWAQSNEYGRYLTPSGAGGDGRTRVFTELDARVVAYIAEMKSAGFTREEIYMELNKLQDNGWVDLPEMPAAPPGVMSTRLIPELTAETKIAQQRQPLLQQIERLNERIQVLEMQIVAAKAERTEERERYSAELEKAREQETALMREMADMREKIGELQAELNLYRSGRLKPQE